MRPTITTQLPRAAAFLVLSGLAGAQAPATEENASRPLPGLEDIRRFAPLPRAKGALQPEEASTLGLAVLAAPEDATRALGSGYLAGIERKVYLDEPGDGSIWAVGETYKAGFDSSGATYVPFFGSAAPRNFPVRFEITEVLAGGEPLGFDPAAQPVRRGERIVFDRGSLLETYDLRVDSVEQLFVFEAPTRPGDLVVRIAVHTELERSADEAGLVLAGECGSVRYSSAVAVDARGARAPVPTTWEDGAIEIRVPAETLAQVRWPLVIDPLVTTFWIDSGTTDDRSPDVAYDLGWDHYQVVYERAFSGSDYDVLAMNLDSNGVLVYTVFVDGTTTHFAKPKVANRGYIIPSGGNQFLVVAEVGDPSGGARYIGGRLLNVNGGLIGSWWAISDTPGNDCINPDVGGTPAPLGNDYCVVWERVLSATNHDIHYRIVDNSVTMSPGLGVNTSTNTIDKAPSISKSNGLGSSATQIWYVAWTREVTSLNHDLYGRQLSLTLGTFPTVAIDTSSANTTSPSPTSPTNGSPRRWLVAYTVSNILSGSYETWGKLMEGSTVLDTADLTLLSGANTAEDQTLPSADCDGTLFVVANSETVTATGEKKIKVSTFSMVGDTIALAEGNVAMATGSSNDQVEIATTGSAGGPKRRAMLAWRIILTAGDGHIIGALYDADPFTQFCLPGAEGVIACPCGNSPTLALGGCNNSNNTGGASLTGQGSVSPDGVTLSAAGMRPSATCIFLQGNGLDAAGAAFGDGVRCVGGTLKRLYVKTATATGTSLAPAVGDSTITARSAALGDSIFPGTKRWYQTYYRDPVDYACASPATFNITGGLQIDW